MDGISQLPEHLVSALSAGGPSEKHLLKVAGSSHSTHSVAGAKDQDLRESKAACLKKEKGREGRSVGERERRGRARGGGRK